MGIKWPLLRVGRMERKLTLCFLSRLLDRAVAEQWYHQWQVLIPLITPWVWQERWRVEHSCNRLRMSACCPSQGHSRSVSPMLDAKWREEFSWPHSTLPTVVTPTLRNGALGMPISILVILLLSLGKMNPFLGSWGWEAELWSPQ
jgi:hypothetical protein